MSIFSLAFQFRYVSEVIVFVLDAVQCLRLINAKKDNIYH